MIIFNAIWAPNLYNVKFNLNKGTTANKSAFATIKNLSVEGEECHIPDIELYRAGYTHVGWNTNANGTGTHYDIGENVIQYATKNKQTITLYAEWE